MIGFGGWILVQEVETKMKVSPLFISGSHHRRKRFLARWSTVELRHQQSELSWKKVRKTFKFFWFFPTQLPIFGFIFWLGLSHVKPNTVLSHSILFAALPGWKNLFGIGLWQLKPTRLDPVLLFFFPHIQIRPTHPLFCKGFLFYLICLFFGFID